MEHQRSLFVSIGQPSSPKKQKQQPKAYYNLKIKRNQHERESYC